MMITPALVGRLVMARQVSSTAASDDENGSHAHLHTSIVSYLSTGSMLNIRHIPSLLPTPSPTVLNRPKRIIGRFNAKGRTTLLDGAHGIPTNSLRLTK